MQPELQLTHRRAKRDFLDRAVTRTAGTGIGARGHTSSTAFLGVGEVQRRVIEDVERVHLELQVEALRKPEVLRYRHVVGEYSRSPHLAKTGVADLTFARIEPHAAGRGRSEERYRVGEGIESLDSRGKCTDALVGTARRLGVDFRAAVTKICRPGQAAAPVGGVRDLPAANDVMPRPARIAGELLALAER